MSIDNCLFFLCNAFFFSFDILKFAIHGFFLLDQSSLGALDFRTPFSGITFRFTSQSVCLFLRLQNRFLLHIFGFTLRVQNQISRLLFRAADCFFADIFTIYISDQRADCKRNHRNYNFHYNWAHCSTSFLFNFCFFLFFFSIIVYNIYCMKIYESKCIT